MPDIHNSFKHSLAQPGAPLIGLFLGLCDPTSTDLLADTGYDWLVVDGEHGPNDIRTILAQLQVLAGHDIAPIVRIPDHDPARIKRMLDIGVQNLLVPMVDTAEQARALVRATRYPPNGVRGVGTALARAARWNGVPGYLQQADQEICLIAQVETRTALDSLDDILAVPGIDAVFIGPSDLAASLGYLGQADHPDVRAAVLDALARIRRSGKAAGIFATRLEAAHAYAKAGARFMSLGTDTLLLRHSAQGLAQAFRSGAEQATGAGY